MQEELMLQNPWRLCQSQAEPCCGIKGVILEAHLPWHIDSAHTSQSKAEPVPSQCHACGKNPALPSPQSFLDGKGDQALVQEQSGARAAGAAVSPPPAHTLVEELLALHQGETTLSMQQQQQQQHPYQCAKQQHQPHTPLLFPQPPQQLPQPARQPQQSHLAQWHSQSLASSISPTPANTTPIEHLVADLQLLRAAAQPILCCPDLPELSITPGHHQSWGQPSYPPQPSDPVPFWKGSHTSAPASPSPSAQNPLLCHSAAGAAATPCPTTLAPSICRSNNSAPWPDFAPPPIHHSSAATAPCTPTFTPPPTAHGHELDGRSSTSLSHYTSRTPLSNVANKDLSSSGGMVRSASNNKSKPASPKRSGTQAVGGQNEQPRNHGGQAAPPGTATATPELRSSSERHCSPRSGAKQTRTEVELGAGVNWLRSLGISLRQQQPCPGHPRSPGRRVMQAGVEELSSAGLRQLAPFEISSGQQRTCRQQQGDPHRIPDHVATARGAVPGLATDECSCRFSFDATPPPKQPASHGPPPQQHSLYQSTTPLPQHPHAACGSPQTRTNTPMLCSPCPHTLHSAHVQRASHPSPPSSLTLTRTPCMAKTSPMEGGDTPIPGTPSSHGDSPITSPVRSLQPQPVTPLQQPRPPNSSLQQQFSLGAVAKDADTNVLCTPLMEGRQQLQREQGEQAEQQLQKHPPQQHVERTEHHTRQPCQAQQVTPAVLQGQQAQQLRVLPQQQPKQSSILPHQPLPCPELQTQTQEQLVPCSGRQKLQQQAMQCTGGQQHQPLQCPTEQGKFRHQPLQCPQEQEQEQCKHQPTPCPGEPEQDQFRHQPLQCPKEQEQCKHQPTPRPEGQPTHPPQQCHQVAAKSAAYSEPSVLQGAVVLLDPQLPHQLAERVRLALSSAGASVLPGSCHLPTSCTCVVCQPEHALPWLSHCVHIVSPHWVLHRVKHSGSSDKLAPKLVCLSPDVSRHVHRCVAGSSSGLVLSDSGTKSTAAGAWGEGHTSPSSWAPAAGDEEGSAASDEEGLLAAHACVLSQAGGSHGAPHQGGSSNQVPYHKRAEEECAALRGVAGKQKAAADARLRSLAGRKQLVVEMKEWEGLTMEGSRRNAAGTTIAPLALLEGVCWAVDQHPSHATRCPPSTSFERFSQPRQESGLNLPLICKGESKLDELQDEVVFRGPVITLLLPRDELRALGHDAIQINPPSSGLTAGTLMSHIYHQYAMELEPSEQLTLMQLHPHIRRSLQAAFLSMQPISRSHLLNKACYLDGGLIRCSGDQCVAAYVLQLI